MATNYSKSTVGGVTVYSGIGEPPYQLGKKGDLFVRTDRPNMYIHYGVDVGWGFFNVNGYTGSAGSLGFVGSNGYTGSRGISTYIKGTVADFDSLPSSPERGDAYIIGTDLYVYGNMDTWENIGRILGDIGYTGSIGFTGSIGIGYTGSEGMAGFMGYTGSQGDIGYTGSSGIDGYTGSQGAGFTGSRGDTGFTGSGGLGYTGSAGAGYTGSAGSAGVNGYTGSIGYTGSAGAGFTGSRGDTGFTGSGGLGYTGSQGAGFTGSQGIQGVIGYTGSSGPLGQTGYTGSIGSLPSLTGNANRALMVDGGEASVSWQPTGYIGVSTVTDADYTLVSGGVGTYIRMSSASARSIIVPDGLSVSNGAVYTFRQVGAGQVTVAAGSGSVIINSAETLKARKSGSTIMLIKVSPNVWDLTGDLEAI